LPIQDQKLHIPKGTRKNDNNKILLQDIHVKSVPKTISQEIPTRVYISGKRILLAVRKSIQIAAPCNAATKM